MKAQKMLPIGITALAASAGKDEKSTDEEIESVMNGNLCRCGTYIRIKKAIKRAVKS